MTERSKARPYLGIGAELRRSLYPAIEHDRPPIDWYEVMIENLFEEDAAELAALERIRRDHPIVLHGISLSIGGADPLDTAYLDRVAALIDRFDPAWVSDHLAWSVPGTSNCGNLRPLPYTGEIIGHVVPRIEAVQARLGRRLLLENIPRQPSRAHSEMSEAEFIGEIAQRSDSLILADLNNLLVNSSDGGFSATAHLDALPGERLWELHLTLSGPEQLTTDAPEAPDPVLALFDHCHRRHGAISTMIDRGDDIPTVTELTQIAKQLRARHP